MIIGARFNGPPDSGNGGYCAGLVASHVSDGRDGARVTLRLPPPLDTEMLVHHDDHSVSVYAGSSLVAEAVACPVGSDDVVAPVGFDEAVAVSASYRGFVDHPFPTCFVCGPSRSSGDGLGLFPGRLRDGRVAAPFVVPADMTSVLVWAALDCPGGWSVPLEARPYVLGQLTARVDGVPAPGDECVVVGVMTGEDGRKAFARTTLYSSSGDLLATARAIWIALA